MNRYECFSCHDWDKELASSDPDMLSDEELDAYNVHLSNCSRCAALISDPEMDAFIRENISLEEVFAMLPQKELETCDYNMSGKLRRSIFIGLGKTGNEVVCQLMREVETSQFNTPMFQYCVIDACEDASRTTSVYNNFHYLNISGHAPEADVQHSSQIHQANESYKAVADWWGERSSTHLLVDESVGQMRAMGRKLLFEHFDDVLAVLQTAISAIVNKHMHRLADCRHMDVSDKSPIVYLVFSLGDATGSGLFLDIAYLIKELFSSHVSPEIVALAVLPGFNQPPGETYTRQQANAYAALQELEYYTKRASIWDVSYPSNVHVTSTQPPFSSVYLIDTTNEKSQIFPFEYVYAQVKRLLLWLSVPEISTSVIKHHNVMTVDDALSHFVNSGCMNAVALDAHEDENIGQLPIYSTFGISHARLDWQADRMHPQTIVKMYEQFLQQPDVSSTLPRFLRSAKALNDTILNEVQDFKGYIPPENSHYISGKVRVSGFYEMMLTLKDEYTLYLEYFEGDNRWQQLYLKYIGQATSAITAFMHIALQEHGPVYVSQALEKMLSTMQELSQALDKMTQEQMKHKNEMDDQVDALLQEWKQAAQIPKENPVVALPEQQNVSQCLYKQYRATLVVICSEHIKTELFNPIARFIEQQQKVFADAQSKLNTLCGQALAAQVLEREAAEKRQNSPTPFLLHTVPPRLTEQEHFDDMYVHGKFDIETMARQALQETYALWPFDDEKEDGIVQLQQHVNERVTQALKGLGKHEHLAYRLQSGDGATFKNTFVAASSLMLNFTDATERRLSELDNVHLLNYGLDSSQVQSRRDIETVLNKFSRDVPGHTQFRQTMCGRELTFINVVHGFTLSSLRILDGLHKAYKFVIETTYGPYLHLFPGNQQSKQLTPSRELWSVQKLLETWRNLLADVCSRRTVLIIDLEDIFKPLQDYYNSTRSKTDFIQVDRPDHPFFEALTNLKEAFNAQLDVLSVQTMQTPEVKHIVTTLEEMEAMLFAQGWRKIDPPLHSLFNPRLHHRYLEDDTAWPVTRQAYIIEVVRPGYMCERSDDPHVTPLVRHAEVIVSTQVAIISKDL